LTKIVLKTLRKWYFIWWMS